MCSVKACEGVHAYTTKRVRVTEPRAHTSLCGAPVTQDPSYPLILARNTRHATEPLSAPHVLAILPPGHLLSSAPQLLAPCGCQFQQASLRLAAASSERDTNRLPNHSTTKPPYYQTTLLPHRSATNPTLLANHSATNPTLLPNNSATNPTLLPSDSTTKPLYVLPNDPTTKPLYYQTTLLPNHSTTKLSY